MVLLALALLHASTKHEDIDSIKIKGKISPLWLNDNLTSFTDNPSIPLAFDVASLIISFAINSIVISGILNEPAGLSFQPLVTKNQTVCQFHVLCYRRNH